MEHLKDFLGGHNRTWSDLGLVPGFSIIFSINVLISLILHGICYLRTDICLEPSTSFFPQVLESTSGFRFQLLYNATRVAKNYD